MGTGERTRLVRKRKVRPYQGRGAIYAWLRAQHAAIVALGSSRPCLWAELVLDMVEDQVVDGNGERPSAHNVRMTWPRVCRDAEAEAASPKRKRTFPSRISPEWRPTIVPPPPTRHVANQPSAPAARLSAGNPAVPADDDMTPEGQAELDKIARILAEHDRKKFGF